MNQTRLELGLLALSVAVTVLRRMDGVSSFSWHFALILFSETCLFTYNSQYTLKKTPVNYGSQEWCTRNQNKSNHTFGEVLRCRLKLDVAQLHNDNIEFGQSAAGAILTQIARHSPVLNQSTGLSNQGFIPSFKQNHRVHGSSLPEWTAYE